MIEIEENVEVKEINGPHSIINTTEGPKIFMDGKWYPLLWGPLKGYPFDSMRHPCRVYISWQDSEILKVRQDAIGKYYTNSDNQWVKENVAGEEVGRDIDFINEINSKKAH